MTQNDRDFQKVLQALTAFDTKLSTLEDVVKNIAEATANYANSQQNLNKEQSELNKELGEALKFLGSLSVKAFVEKVPSKYISKPISCYLLFFVRIE